jgi:hypothetical protein
MWFAACTHLCRVFKMKLRPQAAAPASKVVADAIVVVLIVSQFAMAQQRAQSLRAQVEISLHAVLRSTANLNPQSVRICEELPHEENPGGTIFPLELDWNVSNSVREIQIVASFRNGQRAFEDDRNQSIDAAQWQLNVDEQTRKFFPSRSAGLASELLVATEHMHELGRQGKKVHHIQLRFHGESGAALRRRYCGRLQFRVMLQ